jgi:hypothetical protein
MKLQIASVPLADKFFPSCYWGLVELVAKHRFGVPDIKRTWFNHSIVYTRSSDGEAGLSANGLDLELELTSSRYAANNISRKLRDYFGLGVEMARYENYGSLVAAIRDHIAHGEPIISSFDVGFLRTRREFGKIFYFHSLGIVGWDESQQVLLAIDQFHGRIEVPVADLEACFCHTLTQAREFSLTRCVRLPHRPNYGAFKEDLVSDIEVCLENMLSSKHGLGIRGLRLAAQDVLAASRSVDAPFAIPGMWRIGKDRRCLAMATEHWPSEVPQAQLLRLKSKLDVLFGLWFKVELTLETALHLRDLDRAREAARLLATTIPGEEEVARMLEQTLTHLR